MLSPRRIQGSRDDKKSPTARLAGTRVRPAGPSCRIQNLGALLKIIAPLTVAGFIAALASTAASAADRKVDIINETGLTMSEFYASSTGTENWEEDILGADIMEPGDTFEIDIDDGSGACQFDFKAVFTNGSSHVRRNVNVCKISSFTYTR